MKHLQSFDGFLNESIALDLDDHIDGMHKIIMKMQKEAKTQEEKKIIAKLLNSFSRFDNEVGKISAEMQEIEK
jgi:hypothetical protein